LHHGLPDNSEGRCRTATGEPTPHLRVWPEHGVEAVRARFDDFVRRFKDAGGQANLMILDFEGGFSNANGNRSVIGGHCERSEAISPFATASSLRSSQ